MSYPNYCSQVPSEKLCRIFISEARLNLRAVEASMGQAEAYAGLEFQELCLIHDVQFKAFLRNLRIYNHFCRLARPD